MLLFTVHCSILIAYRSVTPDGHRVSVYWDPRRVEGEEWGARAIVEGLLHSLCFFPLLSHDATAPLAALTGEESDQEDCVLQVRAYQYNPLMLALP